MKIIYAGTPEFAVKPLQKILDAGYDVAAALCQPDRPQGRKGVLTPPPVKALALTRGVPVFQPARLKDELSALAKFKGDILITCAYGQILTQAALDLFPLGVWNLHASLLPRYRGASPIQAAIAAGEKETGVTVMRTALGLDTGDILLSERTKIGERETCGELSSRLSEIAADCLLRALPEIEGGRAALTAQGEPDTPVTKKIGKEDVRLDFSLPAKRIADLVRSANPEPLAFADADGLRINVFAAEGAERPEGSENAAFGEILSDSPKAGFLVACKGGAVRLTEVQAAGGKRMKGSDFLNGRKVKKGQKLC